MGSLSKENIFIIVGAIILTAALLLPQRISTCPKGKTSDPVLGGSCSLFVDENEDGICDVVQGVTAQRRSNFDFSYAPQFLIFLSLFIIAAVFSFVKPKPKFRYLTLAAGLLLGIWTWKRFCPIGTLQLLFLQKDKIVLLLLSFLVFLIPIIAALIAGQIFCFWLCPLGAFQELAWQGVRWISKGLNPSKGSTLKIPDFSSKIPHYINNVNYLVLGALAAGTIYFGEAIFCKICPFGFIFGCSKISVIFILSLLALGFALLTLLFRPFCRFFCPYGAILKILSKFSLQRSVNKGKK